MVLTKNNSINQANCITRRLKASPHFTMNLLNNMLFKLLSLSSQNRKVPLNEKGKKKQVKDLSMVLVTITLSANLLGRIREKLFSLT